MHDVGFPTHVNKTEFVQLLSDRYPDYKWEKVFLLRGKYGQQKRVERAVYALFPVRISRPRPSHQPRSRRAQTKGYGDYHKCEKGGRINQS